MTQTASITVVVADRSPAMRQALTHALSHRGQFQIVGVAASLADVLLACAQTQPQLLIIDPTIRGAGGLDVIRTVRQDCPTTHIVAYTNRAEANFVQAAIQAGASSYLLKHEPLDTLIEALLDACNGKTRLSQEAAQALVTAAQRPIPGDFGLTQRELDVLALMSEGRRNTEIALRLAVSRSTIKKHVSSILYKLNTSSRTEAVSVAIQHHIVRL